MKKFIYLSLIATILLLSIIITSKYTFARETDNGNIEMDIKSDDYKPGDLVTVEILLQDQTEGIQSFTSYFGYNKEIFEQVTKDNIEVSVTEEKLDEILYNTEKDKITIYYNEDISEIGFICKINLKIKEDADLSNVKELAFNMKGIQKYSYDNDNLVEHEDISKTISLSKTEPTPEKLYLSSDIYKIGDKDIDNYEEGDIYLEKISPETTVSQFIKNCKTNGTIKVLNSKGEALKDTDLVGTNMKIQVTKGKEQINLTLVVMGDLDGNGLVTVTDLSGINQAVLKTIELKDAVFKAADLDDNNEITVTDLSGVNQTILKTIKLTYDKKNIKK